MGSPSGKRGDRACVSRPADDAPAGPGLSTTEAGQGNAPAVQTDDGCEPYRLDPDHALLPGGGDTALLAVGHASRTLGEWQVVADESSKDREVPHV